MIAHVAEQGEDRGRVVLQVGPTADLSIAAVEAAVSVAQTFGSEMECLFVEDADLAESTRFAFVQELDSASLETRALSLPDIELGWQTAARTTQDRIGGIADSAGVTYWRSTVRESINVALNQACAERGPWNIVAIGSPQDGPLATRIGDLVVNVRGTTGFVVAGREAQGSDGPVIAIAESIDRVLPMWRTASRIAAATGCEASLLVLDSGVQDDGWTEDQALLALAEDPSARVTVVSAGDLVPRQLADRLCRADPSLVILQFGGHAVPSDAALTALTSELDGAILVLA